MIQECALFNFEMCRMSGVQSSLGINEDAFHRPEEVL
jgi:hypothetical protein